MLTIKNKITNKSITETCNRVFVGNGKDFQSKEKPDDLNLNHRRYLKFVLITFCK